MRLSQHILIVVCALAAGVVGAEAQEHIGSTALAHNDVTRDLAGASRRLSPETRSSATNSSARVRIQRPSWSSSIRRIGVGPRFQREARPVRLRWRIQRAENDGQSRKGVFRFTTGALDKKAMRFETPTAVIGVRGTVLDISVQGGSLSRVTLVEGRALSVRAGPASAFAEQERNCTRAAGGVGGAHCDCVDLRNVGQTAQVKKSGKRP